VGSAEIMDGSLCASLPSYLTGVISAAGIRPESRTGQRAQWDATLEQMPYIPVTYTNARIDYQLAYQQGHGGDWWDLSLVLIHDLRPCGVWPLTFSIKDGTPAMTSYGGPVLPPLFVDGLLEKTRKTLVKGCLDLIESLCRAGGVLKYESGESFQGASRAGVSDWHDQSMRLGACALLRHEMFVDLSMSLQDLKSRFRKSYKSLVTSGTRMWKVHVTAEADPIVWGEFRELHRSVSGRVTRSAESWDLQHQAIAARQSFLVSLRDNRGRLVGGGLFDCTRDEGEYSVGAYDRALFDKPLGHVVQYRAIEEMKARGLRWYKLGYRPYRGQDPQATDKEILIGEFKHGFATHVFPRYLLRAQHGAVGSADQTQRMTS